MENREKMINYIKFHIENNIVCPIEDILCNYIANNFSVKELSNFIIKLQQILDFKVSELYKANRVSKERAGYIKKYLSGEMWTTEEAAKANVQPQINNAQAIIDACDGKSEEFWNR